MFSISVQAQIEIIDSDENPITISSDLQLKLNSEDPENAIISRFAGLGYLNVMVDQQNENLFKIDQGCKFEARLEGLSEIKSFDYGEIQLEEVLESELEDQVQSGRYFSTIEIQSFNPISDQCIVEIEVELSSNEEVFVRDLRFTGNRLNSDSYLLKRSYFTDSLLASSENLDQMLSRIRQTELFESISDPQILIQDGAPIITFEVQERTLNQFDGVLGYVPDASGNGHIVGDISLSLWSVLADGNGLDLDYRRLEPEVSRLNLNVSQHWFGSIPLGLSIGFNFFQNDTTYQTRDLNLQGYYELGDGIELTSKVGFESVTSSIGTTNLIEPGGSRQRASFGFNYSSLIGLEVPREGFRFDIEFGVASKSTDIDSLSAFSQQYLNAHIESYFPLGNQSVFASKIRSHFVLSEDFTDIDLIRFGGANSLRGFNEEQFQASQLIWGDVEYRFLTNASSYLFGFAAAGWFHRPKLLTELNNQFQKSDFINSFGFGLSYKARVGRLTFTYALSPEESLSNAKVHIGVVTRL